LKKEPREDDRKEVESRRLALITQLNILDTLHGSIGMSAGHLAAAACKAAAGNAAVFDDLDDDEVNVESHDNTLGTAATPAASGDGGVLPELRTIVLPSNSGHQHAAHRAEELQLRISQA
jgi:hypothetical protein